MTKKTSPATTTSTPTKEAPKARGRKPATLNISDRPGVGMSYGLLRLSDNTHIRCSTVCMRDKKDPESKLFGQQLAKYSGKSPFFHIKIGTVNTGIKYLKMLVSPELKHCEDTKGEYRWTGLSLAECVKNGIEVDDSAHYVSKDAPAVAKVPKAKVVKAPKKAKSVKAVKKARKAKAIVAAPSETTSTPAADAPLYTNTEEDADVAATTEAVASSVDDVQRQKSEQSDAEFESSINEDFEKELAKAQAKAQS